MSAMNYKGKPMSRFAIRQVAEQVRSSLGLSEEPFFPVVEVAEQILDQEMNQLSFLVGDSSEMGNAEGETCPSGKFIRLREDVYEGACRHRGRPRFTLAHELGHWFLHTGGTLTRLQKNEEVPTYCDVEWQADWFAGELLMPLRFMDAYDTIDEVVERHGVSPMAAEVRLHKLLKEGVIEY